MYFYAIGFCFVFVSILIFMRCIKTKKWVGVRERVVKRFESLKESLKELYNFPLLLLLQRDFFSIKTLKNQICSVSTST